MFRSEDPFSSSSGSEIGLKQFRISIFSEIALKYHFFKPRLTASFFRVSNSTRNEIIKQVFRRGEVLFGGAKTINIDQIKVGSTRDRALEPILIL